MPSDPVAAAAIGLPDYSLSAAAIDIDNLSKLLDLAVEFAVAVRRTPKNACELERISALVWVGRDLAERLSRNLQHLEATCEETVSTKLKERRHA